MLRGWLARGLVARNAVVVEPSPAALGDLAGRGIIHAGTPDAIAADFAADVVVLAVKPQFMDEAIDHYARFARPETLILSIAAGKTIAYFRRHLGADAAVVRAISGIRTGQQLSQVLSNVKRRDPARRFTRS